LQAIGDGRVNDSGGAGWRAQEAYSKSKSSMGTQLARTLESEETRGTRWIPRFGRNDKLGQGREDALARVASLGMSHFLGWEMASENLSARSWPSSLSKGVKLMMRDPLTRKNLFLTWK